MAEFSPRALILRTAKQLEEAGIPDPATDAALLLEHLTGTNALALRLDMDTVLDDTVLARYEALCAQRKQRIPLQYLTGMQSFFGRDFQVDSRVLIPRPETELLAELVIQAARSFPAPQILDLCCGSGCLCVTAALECPTAIVHGSDLSSGALEVSESNARRLGASVIFHQGDLFAPLHDLRFQIIVSNPPYIPAEECNHLQQEVMFEPNLALDGGEDGLDFYRRIAVESPEHLLPGGILLMEVGWNQADCVADLLREAGFVSIKTHNDYAGISRMVEGHLP